MNYSLIAEIFGVVSLLSCSISLVVNSQGNKEILCLIESIVLSTTITQFYINPQNKVPLGVFQIILSILAVFSFFYIGFTEDLKNYDIASGIGIIGALSFFSSAIIKLQNCVCNINKLEVQVENKN